DGAVDGGRREDSRRITTRTPRHETGMSYFVPYRVRLNSLAQGRQFQSVLDEALREYIDRQQKDRPRRHVMTAFAFSLDELDSLYRELAK
ncbi:MAG: hypothetical protein AADX98_20125, partial [Thiocapsa sp. C3-3m]